MKSHGIAYLNQPGYQDQPGYQGVSWNPVVGCSHAGAGCANCYAEALAASRLYKTAKYKDLTRNGRWTGEVRMWEPELDKPLHWRKPRCVFVCDMGDLFHRRLRPGSVDRVIEIVHDTPRHRYLFLTKRPRIMAADMALWELTDEGVPRNAWFGASAWDQASADANVPHLLRVPAAVRWLSLEPLLGPVDLHNVWLPGCGLRSALDGVDRSDREMPCMNWVVPGCESGPNRRPCKLDWVRSVVLQCADAGVKCFVKQLDLDGRVSHDPAEWPEDLRVREYPDA